MINSPSNPSGAVLDREEFERILALTSSARHLVDDGRVLIADFVYDGEPYSIASTKGAKDTVLVAGSLSKTYSMTGWRIGFGLGPAPSDARPLTSCKATALRIRLPSRRRPPSKPCVDRNNLSSPCSPSIGRRRDYRHRTPRHDSRREHRRARRRLYAYPDISCALKKKECETPCSLPSRSSPRLTSPWSLAKHWHRQSHPYLLRGARWRDLRRGLDRLHKFIVEA